MCFLNKNLEKNFFKKSDAKNVKDLFLFCFVVKSNTSKDFIRLQ